jgi:hypothetical protein
VFFRSEASLCSRVSHQDQEGEVILSRVTSDHQCIKINFRSALVSSMILLISRFTWAESVEHLLHLGPRLARARRESRNNRQKAIAP